jgi:hypothetical protein
MKAGYLPFLSTSMDVRIHTINSSVIRSCLVYNAHDILHRTWMLSLSGTLLCAPCLQARYILLRSNFIIGSLSPMRYDMHMNLIQRRRCLF